MNREPIGLVAISREPGAATALHHERKMLDENSLRVATRALYDKRHTGYWTYPILLDPKFDSKVSSLNLTDDEASAIFQTLEELGFLKRMDGRTILVGGIERQQYRVNYARVREYYEFAHPPFYYHCFSDFWIYKIQKYSLWVVGIVALLLTSFFSGLFEKLAEKIVENWK
jgi:hypothetical protein